MCIMGNPVDYILIFGGTSVEYLSGIDLQANVRYLKTTLNDFWVYNIVSKIITPIYVNSR